MADPRALTRLLSGVDRALLTRVLVLVGALAAEAYLLLDTRWSAAVPFLIASAPLVWRATRISMLPDRLMAAAIPLLSLSFVGPDGAFSGGGLSAGDLASIAGLSLLAASLWVLREPLTPDCDRGVRLDVAMAGVVLAVLISVLFLQPAVTTGGVGVVARIALPVTAGLVLWTAARAGLGRLKAGPARPLAVASAGLIGLGHVLIAVLGSHGLYGGAHLVDLLVLAGAIGVGLAALQPDVTREVDAELSRARTAVLFTILGVAMPASLVVGGFPPSAVELVLITIGAVVLSAIGVTRMSGLVLDRKSSVERERQLREAGSALVAAPTVAAVYRAAVEGFQALSVEAGLVRVCIRRATPSGFRLVARSSSMAGGEDLVITDKTRERLERGILILEPVGIEARLAGEQASWICLAPLRMDGMFWGLVEVATDEALSKSTANVIGAITNELALALHGRSLAQEMQDERLRSLVKTVSDVIAVLDEDKSFSFVSAASAEVLGRPPEHLVETSISMCFHPDDTQHVADVVDHLLELPDGSNSALSARVLHPDGSVRHLECRLTRQLANTQIRGIVVTMRDITDWKTLEQQLQYQATHDPLTGLPNRVVFHDRVEHALDRMTRELAVMFLDVDDFKTVNDSLGHSVGDLLLKEFADMLEAAVPSGTTVARVSGDEFAVLLEDIDGPHEAVDVARRILSGVNAPIQLDGREVKSSVSVGIALASNAERQDPSVLIRNADTAMYVAKRDGKNRYKMYVSEMHTEARRRLSLKEDVAEAIATGAIDVVMQPIVRAADRQLWGAEALARWTHPEQGNIPPSSFVPLAEEAGLIHDLGGRILDRSCEEAARWQREQAVMVSVNVSAAQLADETFLPRVEHALEATGLDPTVLMLEITESVIVGNLHGSIDRLRRLQDRGITVAIDDFGTGYSSLSYLRELPIDLLKIDKSFVDRLGQDESASAMVRSMIDLAGALGLRTLAEGIETEIQAAVLADLGCELLQGYLFSKPLPVAAMLAVTRGADMSTAGPGPLTAALFGSERVASAGAEPEAAQTGGVMLADEPIVI